MDDVANAFTNVNLDSKYFDMESFTTKYAKSKTPLILSVNIQSLFSKFDHLKDFIIELLSKNVPIDAIAIQETWQISQPNQIQISGFHPFIYETRKNNKGGGSGFTSAKISSLKK
jgi:hypothetical protein